MLPSSLLPFFFLLFLILHATKLDADSDQFICNGFKDTDLSLNGEASVTRGLLNLGNIPQKSSHASRSFPSSAGKIPSFSTSFVFVISSDYANRSANGFALVISTNIGSQNNLQESSLISMISQDNQLASIGFSSATGPTHSGHYILGWSFTTDGEAQPLNHSALPLEVAHDFAKQDNLKPPNNQRQEQDRCQLPNHNILAIVILSVLVAMSVLVAVIVVLLCRKKKAGKCEDWEAKCGPRSFRLLPIKKELLLVYDYMPNGSLDKYLHDQDNTPTIGWAMRLGIIKGITSGLFYLHEDWEHVVIHRDIKTSNVLLDTDMNGRLGDFGLARLHDHGADAHTTHFAGTWGYIAPELSRLGKATKATDVFALQGVLVTTL
ncbi:Os09g0315600 [Oryza sativa Japonica Group]|uniref:Os09g0315600 protein n=1 Tax=Oryza sativa subsp. japonica TaxID=39947 RepID=Q0J2Q5_ORYSJ|nr:Os09g0315600 [Oryza sativa Japonica Group]|eukprot:NP_001062846.1 Os09g0315600 [Oryza sativa Japonica Group]